MAEKYSLNGRPRQTPGRRGEYGALRKKDEDRVKILPDDASSEASEGGIHMDAQSSYPLPEALGNYFRDGRRKIDFVLVYEDDLEKPREVDTQKGSLDHKRYKFLESLRKSGLEMEEDQVQSEKKVINFIKLFAPWDVCCFYAEDLCMRAPLQAHPNPASNWSNNILATLRIPNMMHEDLPNQPLDYYTCAFKKSKLHRFLGSDNQDTYFTATQRSRVVWEILTTAAYGKRKRAEIGIERLLEEEVYTAAFPLHEGPYELPKHGVSDASTLNPRQVLYHYWARWWKWNKYQPLDHIREYFGEKIGIYFAWLGFYTAWLLPASVMGIVVFMYGIFTMNANTPANEACESNDTFRMCPLCDENIGCPYWYLSDVCIYMKVSYLFDHPATVFYSVFISFWAVTFLEYWKRKNASLAHHWDVVDFEEEEERPRPEYAAKAPTYEKNPITGIKEPHFPPRKRLPRILSGIAVIIVMMTLVIIFIIAVIMYRVLVSIPLFQNATTRPRAQIIASMSAAVVNLILIMALGRVYEKLALKMTQWEMHRTQTEFEDQLTFKVFIFQFVNFYSSIIYIAFFKGRFVGYPGHYTKFFGLRSEECSNGGCLVELAQQLAVIMIGKQIINNAQEILVPLESYAGRSRNLDELDQSLVGDLTVVEMHLLKSQDFMRVRGKMLNLDKYQVDWVCKHLGHIKSVHKAHYQQMSDFIERVHIAKLLLVQDMNLTKQFKGKKLEDIDVSEIVFPEETTAVQSGKSEVLAESVSKVFLELERKIKTCLHRMKLKMDKSQVQASWEQDYELIENEGLFQEYLEMVLQFGFITIFVAAFPLAPLFALLNNWVEIRLDAQKFVCETRRPVADRAQDIGVWFVILDALAQIAVISNAFLIAFTSEFLPRLLYQYQYDWDLKGYTNFTLATSPNGTLTHSCRYRAFRDSHGDYTMFYWHLLAIRLCFVIVFEHFVFGVCRLIDLLVPDVPESLALKIKRERYLAKQALADTDAIMKIASYVQGAHSEDSYSYKELIARGEDFEEEGR